ncbi:hypothetical protein LP420_36325 [Massilia sp. B-10]|nr:hypothetical protein LP420_36325 [Massilia sp. B-10]
MQGSEADLLVCTELSLCGYYPGDLLEEESFLARTEAALAKVLTASKAVPALVSVIGTVRLQPRAGQAVVQCAAGDPQRRSGRRVLQAAVANLWHFRRAAPFRAGTGGRLPARRRRCTVGFLICEDGWNSNGHDYKVDPFAALRAEAPDLVVSINASPTNIGKREQRHALFHAAAHHQPAADRVREPGRRPGPAGI